MNKLIRFYNQNRALVISIIFCIVLILIIIQVLNSFVKEGIEENKNRTIIENEESTKDNTDEIKASNVSAITGEEVKNNESNLELIKEFVENCNNGKIENAYNLLSADCKALLYPTLERFKIDYIDRIFYMNRIYSLENWYTTSAFDTYYIKYTEDVLATGNTNSRDNYNEYITIINYTNGKYINVGNYVGTQRINMSKEENGIKVQVNKMHMYIDYTILDITVDNSTLNTLCIDTKEKLNTTFIYDRNDVRYTAFLNEIADVELQIKGKQNKNLEIKFNKRYNPESRDIIGFTLKDIVLNYGQENSKKMSFDIQI